MVGNGMMKNLWSTLFLKIKQNTDKTFLQELRAQYHDQIAENEMLIEALRPEPKEIK